MSSPKLYLILVNNNIVDKITTYRELDAVQNEWDALTIGDKIGIVHCGFVRPSISERIELPSFVNGKIIYSSALKWALPDTFKSSTKPVVDIALSDQITPCYLALDQWGYEVVDEEMSDKEVELHNYQNANTESCRDTISLAAQQVLKDANKHPLNKEEIYARIIESDYYHFNTPKPVHVLDVTLNRETVGTEYSKPAKTPLFGKTKAGHYYLLEDKTADPKGWLRVLSNEYPQLYEELIEYGVFDDKAYLTMRDQLSNELCADLDKVRFLVLKKSIVESSPYDLLQICPQWILDQEISSFGFNVRVTNSLLSAGSDKLSELTKLSTNDFKSMPNMGKKSITDLCTVIITKITNKNDGFYKISNLNTLDINVFEDNPSGIEPQNTEDQISTITLRQHLDRTLDELNEVDRLVLHGRLGFKGKVLTLEEVAEKLDVTRERIRQRQNKYVERIIAIEDWDDAIGIKIGQLLIDRAEPLILEMLEIEDSWFNGFEDNYVYLANVIQMFSENAIRVIEVQGRNVVTRISKKIWDPLVRDIKNNLKQKAVDKIWTHNDVDLYFESSLSEHSAKELLPLMQEAICDFLQFENESADAILVAYGKTAESAVAAVLATAETPLHFSEIAKRASDLLGRKVDERRAHGAVKAKGVWLYDRGTFGLIDHCPLPESKRKSIRQIVEHLLYQGEINKQWHSKEIIEELRKNFPSIPSELNPYVLRMCIEDSERINFLNRMVWARSDSGLGSGDRVEVSDAFVQILEDAGEPLSGQELKNRLSDIRGVDENMQIHPNERLVTVRPNVWGLSEWSL